MVTQLSLVTPVANPHRALLWLTASRTFSSPVQMDRAEAVEGSEDKAAATYAARHQSLFRSVNEQIEDKNYGLFCLVDARYRSTLANPTSALNSRIAHARRSNARRGSSRSACFPASPNFSTTM